MFGTMLDLTTSPPSRSNATIWRRVPAYIIPNNDNRLHDFIAPPRDMLDFNLVAAIHRSQLVSTRDTAGPRASAGPYYYSSFGYIGNLLYYLEFTPERTR
jgi:hypothetical protein